MVARASAGANRFPQHAGGPGAHRHPRGEPSSPEPRHHQRPGRAGQQLRRARHAAGRPAGPTPSTQLPWTPVPTSGLLWPAILQSPSLKTDAHAIGLAFRSWSPGRATRGIGLWMTVTEMRKPGRKLWLHSGSGSPYMVRRPSPRSGRRNTGRARGQADGTGVSEAALKTPCAGHSRVAGRHLGDQSDGGDSPINRTMDQHRPIPWTNGGDSPAATCPPDGTPRAAGRGRSSFARRRRSSVQGPETMSNPPRSSPAGHRARRRGHCPICPAGG